MTIIRNINEAYGEPISFSGDTIESCISEMARTIVLCGVTIDEPLRDGVDYEIIED